jgi:hypothetical protein
MRPVLPSLTVVIFLGAVSAANGQTAGLERTEKGFRHAASGTEFVVPEKWQAQQPRPLPSGVSVGITFPDPRIIVTVYWVPLENSTLSDFIRLKPEGPNSSYGREHDNLKLFYGPEKVGKPEEVKLGDRVMYKVPVLDGPDKAGNAVGVLYLWEAGANAKERWRIKLRATYPKTNEAEHAKAVEKLLQNFR